MNTMANIIFNNNSKEFRDGECAEVRSDEFKIIYVGPMLLRLISRPKLVCLIH